MTTAAAAIVVVSHVVLPIGLATWLLLRRPASVIDLLGHAAMVFSFLLFFALLGAAWSWVSFLPCAVAFVVAIAGFVRAARYARWNAPFFTKKSAFAAALNLVFAALFAFAFTEGVAARQCPDGAVALRSPFKTGTYWIMHGGSRAVANQHHAVHAQTYALDIVRLHPFGTRARGLVPGDLNAYAVYGTEVVAPCAGEILYANGERDDRAPGSPDPDSVTGNAVLLYCDGVTLLLAHLQHDSLSVSAGDHVRAGDALARAGNTGNTSEPHLHMHAVRGSVSDLRTVITSAEPIAMRIDGRFLARNDWF